MVVPRVGYSVQSQVGMLVFAQVDEMVGERVCGVAAEMGGR